MRVISFVPSWTETLIHWGVEVVGRTRYCIHPESQVASIPIIGGTKDSRWEKIQKLNAELILVDKEENKKSVLDKSPLPLHITHVESIYDMPKELERMKQTFSQLKASERILKNIENDILRWKRVLQERPNVQLQDAVMDWIQKPKEKPKKIVYVIWRNPWMRISRNTFIGSVLSHMGYENELELLDEKYQKFEIENLIHQDTLFLFSSEPYEFCNKNEVSYIHSLNIPSALVQGESFSWFGERSLAFLENKS